MTAALVALTVVAWCAAVVLIAGFLRVGSGK